MGVFCTTIYGRGFEKSGLIFWVGRSGFGGVVEDGGEERSTVIIGLGVSLA